MVMYKVKDIQTGLFRRSKNFFPRWDDVGTLFTNKASAKNSVSYSTKNYEIIGYEVTLTQVSTETYKGQR